MRMLMLLLACLYSVQAQQFEVASIKPSPPSRKPSAIRGGPGTADPTHLYVDAISIQGMIAQAFGVRSSQVEGPAFLTAEHFDVAATIPEGASRDALIAMWRDLIYARFGVRAHTIQRDFAAYDLTMAPRGHRFIPNNEPPPAVVSPQQVIFDERGKPGLPEPGLSAVSRSTPRGAAETVMVGRAQPLKQLAVALTARMDRPVVDKTGLVGNYDFVLTFSSTYAPVSRSLGGATDPSVTIEDALQQLGLRLVSSKTVLDVIVVEQSERTPTEN